MTNLPSYNFFASQTDLRAWMRKIGCNFYETSADAEVTSFRKAGGSVAYRVERREDGWAAIREQAE